MDVVKKTMGIRSLSPDLSIPGFQVDLISVVVWALREMRLHCPDKTELELNLKLDGRPFWGIIFSKVNIVVPDTA